MSTLKKTENNLGQDEKVRSLWKQSVIQFKHNRLAVVGLVIIVLFIVTILTTLAIDQITNYSFYNEYIIKQDLSLRLAKPSLAHPFGCDEFGRDLLLRILWGTKLSFAIGVVAIALSVIMGAPFGMIAAFYGGKTDNAIMRVMDVLLAVPYMLLAMAIVAALGTSTFNLLLALAVSGIAKYARIARAAVLTVKDSEFVEAARAVGASDDTILFQYILPNALAPILVQVSLGIGDSILAVAGLSYLGLGVQPPQPEWGAILTTARTYMRDAWHISVFPGLFLILAVIAFNLFGDGLRDALDPKLKR
ncbi:MAG: ABC transporter permease [Clostridia bacterium]|nr:ABC transporter permease [Clostridia bacterium]